MTEILKYIVCGLGGLYLLLRIGSLVVFLIKEISIKKFGFASGLSKKLCLQQLKAFVDPFSLHKRRILSRFD
jgi:hypothetical protein